MHANRLLEQLYCNLAPRSITALAYQNTQQHISTLKKTGSLDHILTELNLPGGKVNRQDLGKISLVPSENYRHKHELLHCLPPTGFGFALTHEHWCGLLKKARLPKDVRGCLVKFMYVRNGSSIEQRLIFIEKDTKEIESYLEHEMIHNDRDVYSLNQPAISKMTSPLFEAYILEMFYVDELNAGKNYSFSTRKPLNQFYDEHIFTYSTIKKPELRESIGAAIRQKLTGAQEALREMMQTQIRPYLTPLLYSVGPKWENARKGRFHSSLEDIEQWHNCLHKGEIRLNKVKEILVNKGYTTP